MCKNEDLAFSDVDGDIAMVSIYFAFGLAVTVSLIESVHRCRGNSSATVEPAQI